MGGSVRAPARARRRRLAACLALLTAAAVSALPARAAAADPSTCTVSAILVNSCRPWLGAYAGNYLAAGTGAQNQLLYHEQRIGRQVDIVHSYHGVGDIALSASDQYFATRPGTMLYVNWKPTANWAAITSQNAGIDQMAASIKSLGTARVFLALYHEPEKSVSPGGDPNCPAVQYKGSSGTVADYRNMWQYVENRFAADGVNNVVWVLDYMNYAPWDCLVPDLYPGDQYVDWVTFNAYQSSGTATFADVVTRFYNLLAADTDAQHSFTDKPWGIAEWGTHGYSVAQEEAYYDSAKTALDSGQFPRLKMYLAFDDTDQNIATGANYRVGYDDNGTLDPAKGARYTAFADDPLLAGGYQPPDPPPDITAPTASLTAPADQSTVQGRVGVTGTASDDRAVADVRLLVDGADSGVQATGAPGAPTFAWDSTGVPNGPHVLQVQATDGAGNVGLSNSVNVTVANPDVTAPTTPAGLRATAVSFDEVNLSWNASTDNVAVDAYRVYRDGDLVATVNDGTSYLDTNVRDATTYDYSVEAVDAAGNVSQPSDQSSATTPDATPPSVATDVTAAPTGPHSIEVDWQPATDNVAVDHYDIYRDGSFVGDAPSGTSYTDTGLTDATQYSYAVVAVDGTGNRSDSSAAAAAATPDGTAPTTPIGVHVKAVSATQTTLTWSKSTDNVGVTGYVIYRNGAPLASVGTATTYQDLAVTGATVYRYTVAATDAAGNVSPASAAVQLRTPGPDTTAPTVPTNLTAALTSTKAVLLRWGASTDNVGVAGYLVLRDGQQIASTPASTRSFTDSTAAQAQAHTYTVQAFDAAGNVSGPSNAVTITVPDTIPPSAPTNLTLTPGLKSITLAWTASTDNVGVKGYLIFRNGVQIANYTGGTSFTNTRLTTGTTYSYYVIAYDAAGKRSVPSATVSAVAG